jgi:hypothetical protein
MRVYLTGKVGGNQKSWTIRAQSGTVRTLPISLDFINLLDILVFTILLDWTLMAALH